jgi:hypothetical protein
MNAVLDDNSALCMYIKAGDAPWEYCGCVANAKPSDVFTLRWPVDEAGRAYPTAAVGVREGSGVGSTQRNIRETRGGGFVSVHAEFSMRRQLKRPNGRPREHPHALVR